MFDSLNNFLFFIKSHGNLIVGFEESTNKTVTIEELYFSYKDKNPISIKGYDLQESKILYEMFFSHFESNPFYSFDTDKILKKNDESISYVISLLNFMKKYIEYYFFYDFMLE